MHRMQESNGKIRPEVVVESDPFVLEARPITDVHRDAAAVRRLSATISVLVVLCFLFAGFLWWRLLT